MAKTNMAVEADEKQEGGDAPLIDLNDASVKKLIARGKKRGYITYDELNEALPQDQNEQIADIMSSLSEMGINVVESEKADDDDDRSEPEIDTAADDSESGEGERDVFEKKKLSVDRTVDPVRMYLREMGAVEL